MPDPTAELADENNLPPTPRLDSLHMPAEWADHARTWISWPHRKELWGSSLDAAEEAYHSLISLISQFEPVSVIYHPHEYPSVISRLGKKENIALECIDIDDSWIRDNGPTFLVGEGKGLSATIWQFNGWGHRFVPFEHDAQVAQEICNRNGIHAYLAPITCEGGAIHTDGKGTLLTTSAVILNQNRNPGISKSHATELLSRFTGTTKVIWLPNGIVDDETDGHIDNVACFVNPTTLFAAYTPNRSDENYASLHENFEVLSNSTNAAGEKLSVIHIPLPAPVIEHGRRLTASYLNFYFVNGAVIVPIFDDPNDEAVLRIFEDVFEDRKIIPFGARAICVGGGGIHCITLNESLGKV